VLFASVHLPKRMIRWTMASVLLLITATTLIRVEYWTHSFETLSVWRPILTAVVYMIHPLILIALMQITAPFRKKEWWLTLPWLLCIPVFATSQFTGIVCSFSPDNRWEPGPLRYLPYILFGIYLAIFSIRYFISYRKAQPAEKIGVVFIVLSGVVSVPLYLFLQTDDAFDFTNLFTADILLFYLFLYIHSAKTDPLTELYNRQCYYKDMHAPLSRIGAVASVDMNELKWINDTQGHAAGDEAIKTVADCLISGIANKRVYRIGGDEFTIFYFTKDDFRIKEDLVHMRKRLAETPFSCAFGYALVQDRKDIEEVVKKADQAMYENKAELKKAILEGGGKLHRRAEDFTGDPSERDS